MGYSCKILLDSISETNKRLTTFEITFPRIVLAEFNTHRMFSRNSASSRAIPFKKRIETVIENPFIPDRFPIDGKGMQPNSYIDKNDARYILAYNKWIEARDLVLDAAAQLHSSICEEYNYLSSTQRIYKDWDWQNDNKPEPAIHKQIVNRLLESFQWHTVIVTATEFDNFFKLRTHTDAQYEIKRIADLMYSAYHWNWDCYSNQLNKDDFPYDNPEMGTIANVQKLKVGEWHCPLVSNEDEELIIQYLGQGYDTNHIIEIEKKISVARCARVSYLTHDGKRDIEKDLELFERLRTSGHWSPFEHVATPAFTELDYEMDANFENEIYTVWPEQKRIFHELHNSNFIGWKQYRKEFQDENCTNFRKEN